MDKIIEDLLALPKEQRKSIMGILKNSLVERGKNIDERFSFMKKIADKLVGEDILTNTRDAAIVYGRKMVAYAMRKEGFSLSAIGKKLKKDHSTICFMEQQMQEMIDYPHIFKAEIKLWNAFKEKIHYDDSRAS